MIIIIMIIIIDSNTNRNWRALNAPQRFGKGAAIAGNLRTNRDHPNYSITKIGFDTEKSPGVLKRLAVSQTPLRQ